MKKHVFGRQLSRDINERTALFRGLMSSLVVKERIITTEAKAKAIRSEIERLVTKARKGGRHAQSLLRSQLHNEAAKKMLQEIGPRFQTRPGGYTRIIKLENRFSDNARMAYIEWVDRKLPVQEKIDKKAKKPEMTAIESEARSTTKTAKTQQKKAAVSKTKETKDKKAPVKAKTATKEKKNA